MVEIQIPELYQMLGEREVNLYAHKKEIALLKQELEKLKPKEEKK